MAKYNSKIVREVCKYISEGCSNKDSALLTGITEETFYSWRKLKPEFSESVKKAEAKRKKHLIGVIFSAAEKQWTAAAWYLERVYPEEYGKSREPETKNEETTIQGHELYAYMVRKAREDVPDEKDIDKVVEVLEDRAQKAEEERKKSEISKKEWN